MHGRRKKKHRFIRVCALAALSWMILGPASPAAETANDRWKTKTELQLTEEFYKTLRSEGTKTYATGSSDEYLRQIAVSTRFLVETNLKILQRQERIIQLLEALQNKPTVQK